MDFDQDEELPVRSPIDISPARNVTTQDEENYSTLVDIQNTINLAIAGLYKDFNAFKILDKEDDTTATKALLRQIAGKQEAYDILAPIQEQLNSVIDQINEMRKGGQ